VNVIECGARSVRRTLLLFAPRLMRAGARVSELIYKRG